MGSAVQARHRAPQYVGMVFNGQHIGLPNRGCGFKSRYLESIWFVSGEIPPIFYADVAELADAPDLGSGGLSCAGSTPVTRTIKSTYSNFIHGINF